MKVTTHALDIVVERTLSQRELVPGVSAFTLVDTFTAKGDVPGCCRALLETRSRHGIAKTSAIKQFEQGKAKELKGDQRFYLVPPEYLTLVREQGFTAPGEDKELTERIAAANDTPLEMPEGWSVVVVDYASHMLFDVEGQPLPVGLYYDYMSGMVCDGAYFIEKMVPYLKEHPQVQGFRGKAIECQSVPYYNVSPGCSRYTTFVFGPTQAQMLALWECAQKLNKHYPSAVLREAVFELDLLGLRAAGIARSDSFYGVSEPEPEPEPSEDCC